MKTLALVIGNNNYDGDSRLDNAVNDAKSIAETFERLGYEVIYRENCNTNDCSNVLTEFDAKISQADSSIFYFAGHGFQYEGENYLASTECPVENPNKHICERTCIRLTEIFDIIKKANTNVNIIIIDACRKGFSRGTTDSFIPIHTPKGTIIAYSTSPGEGAKDKGMEGHSIYTGVLLKYIGRELLSVEDLFKKVRKTVYNLTGGSQTTWEHTSLIGDFYFNTGQMVYSVSIPYDDSVVKDRTYTHKGTPIDDIIFDLKSCNWNKQNPAMDKLNLMDARTVDKDTQFIIGRNILQAGGYAHNATKFFEDLSGNLARFSNNGENHLLNGILFEIYFDSNGDFRRHNFKRHCIDKVFAIRHNPQYRKSFDFIENALVPFKEELYYIPSSNDKVIDVDILASILKTKNVIGEEEEYQIIESIHTLSKDITKPLYKVCQTGTNLQYLKNMIANYLNAPIELVNLIVNIEIKKLAFRIGIEPDESDL